MPGLFELGQGEVNHPVTHRSKVKVECDGDGRDLEGELLEGNVNNEGCTRRDDETMRR